MAYMSRRIELADGGWVRIHDPWLDEGDARRLMSALSEDVEWTQRSIRMGARIIPQPRLTAWFGEPGATYTYSGLTLDPAPFPPAVAEIRAAVEDECGARFNGVLLNLYRDGADSMGWHADAERELGKDPLIASVSLGASRRFVLRHRKRAAPAVEFELGGGSLLVMGGTTQHHWRHGIPKTRRAVGPRVNLTFRRIVE